ncbi:cytochrome c [Bradyrhizobium sp.]|uniref:c-type cytochrome n=1 Tax=Bradyrhizobium sp. TaxID=376 RepID=UPI002610D33D|nr:cytochrome c [Bradyrhizobium sp.]
MNRSFELRAGKRPWPIVAAACIVAVLIACLGAASVVIYGGVYDIAADTPHSQPVYWLLQKVRQYSIAARAHDDVPNDLGEAKRIASGAGQYAEMCSGCHLAPGIKRTEVSRGLYPRAPELRRGSALTPAEEFWVVKHGIKMTGMPAWGVTHDDELLWDVVAFLRKMPELTAEQYKALVESAPTHDEMMQKMDMGHGHRSEQASHR